MPTPRTLRKPDEGVKKADVRFRSVFAKVPIPPNEANLPKQLSTLSSDKVSDLQLNYAAWRELTEDLLVEALSDFTYKKSKFDFEFNKKLLITSGSTVKEKEAKVSVDEYIHDLQTSMEEAELYHDLLTRKLESYNNCLAVISREISRRSSDGGRS